MPPIAPRPAYGLLRCPICRQDLALSDRTLACPDRHSFDIAGSGYVNLLSGRSRRPAAGGDDKSQLERRAAFLGAGHFDFITAAILDDLAAGAVAAGAVAAGACVIEAGSGSGYHLDRVVAGLGGHGLGLDLSRDAAQWASRRYKSLAFAVADIWQDWPVQSAVADLVLSLFAPKNFGEMARVLRPDGRLVIVYPGDDHLIELRHDFGLMGIAGGKTAEYRDTAAERFGDIRVRCIMRQLQLAPEDVANVILMGPNATRLAGRVPALPGRPMTVTCAVELLFAARPRAAADTQ
ncbi:MAG TPA: methyltransferase domain-containing protein [Stellaceae bacterium]|nr:methyltransferase domain-containing protein [Stellaceae bacterium]